MDLTLAGLVGCSWELGTEAQTPVWGNSGAPHRQPNIRALLGKSHQVCIKVKILVEEAGLEKGTEIYISYVFPFNKLS